MQKVGNIFRFTVCSVTFFTLFFRKNKFYENFHENLKKKFVRYTINFTSYKVKA